MAQDDDLTAFTRAALAEGHDRGAIARALEAAGWSATETAAAMEAWADVPGLPPVPRPRPYVSAREALAYGLLFVSLGMVTWNMVTLGSALADRLIPDLADPAWRGGTGSSRWSIAALATFLPLFLVLNRAVNRASAADARARRRSLVRKWFASITLLLASLALLGDLSMTIYAFLNGDLTLRFAAKAALVAVVAALVFAYYRDELDG